LDIRKLLDAPQLVVRADDEVGIHAGEVGGVALPAGKATGLGLQLPVHRLRCTGQLDEPVTFD